jgi:glycyl-tRNA synthetase
MENLLMKSDTGLMDKIVSLCKRRGFVFQDSEIYGGAASLWDYGPLGVELKRNVKNLWWKSAVLLRDDIVGLDSSILMHPHVWKASGHLEGFSDPLVDCRKCKHRFKADDLQSGKCPECGGELTKARQFNLMFKTFMGPVEEHASTIYLRPETAQGIFVNFQNILNSSRFKLPFGVAQIGKAFRNEITPGNFTFRTREFEQMEIEYFVKPGSDEEFFEKWKEERFKWYIGLGIKPEHLRMREHAQDELAHYAKRCVDIEYKFPFGWAELEGIANRTDFDLKKQAELSGKDLTYYDDKTNERYYPYIIEPSGGVDRTVLALLTESYEKEGERAVLHFMPEIAPVKAGVFPLVNRDRMPEKAREIYELIKPYFKAFYDAGGSVGRRYRRQDEIGTPYCITIDSQTMTDDTVTLRDRDTMAQVRVKKEEIVQELKNKMGGLKP